MNLNDIEKINKIEISLEEKIKTLEDEVTRLKGFENIVRGFTQHENICLALLQKEPPLAVFVNRGFELLTGYTKDEIYKFTHSDLENLIHPDMRNRFFHGYYQCLKGDPLTGSCEFIMLRKNGEHLSVESFLYLIDYDGEPSIAVTFVDRTKMREIERALRDNRENYRLLFNKSPVSIFYYDKDLHINHFNDKFVDLLQSKRESLSGLDLRTINDKSIIPCLESAIKGNNGYYKGHYRVTTSNAEIVISMKTEPLYNDSGEVSGGVGIIEDIKKTEEIEEALQKSEENFKDMIDLSPLPIAVVDVNDNIVYVNREGLELFAYSHKDIKDLESWWNKSYPDPLYRKSVIDDWYSGYKNAQKKKEIFGAREYKVTCGDGIIRDIEFHVVPVGDLSFIIMNDMTRHRKAEAELLRTRKIESVGILAGGIAHDFNNILTGIIGNLNIAKMDITKEHKSYVILDSIEKAAWRARDLTQQLLTFSRGGAPIKKVTSIKQLLADSASFVLTGTEIKLELDIADDLLDADIDEGQISQVVHNLVINARESITGRGVIKIRAENFVNEGNEYLDYEGNYILIHIEDSGVGINPSVIPNIFDPFFTTKDSGTGLGLSVSYSIVKKHGGNIKVFSVEGEGTTFEVFLPASDEKCIPSINQDIKMHNASGRILVMDDEALVLDVAKKLIIRMGYDVEVVNSGEETFTLYKKAKESGNPFDCVIMDLTIPGGMGGKDVLILLKKYDPDVKAIVSSGYSNDPVMSEYEEYGFAGVSVKPYSFEDLRKEIERVVSRKCLD